MLTRLRRAVVALAVVAGAVGVAAVNDADAFTGNKDWVAGAGHYHRPTSGIPTWRGTSGVWLKSNSGPTSGQFYLLTTRHTLDLQTNKYAESFTEAQSTGTANSWLNPTDVILPSGAYAGWDMALIKAGWGIQAPTSKVANFCPQDPSLCRGTIQGQGSGTLPFSGASSAANRFNNVRSTNPNSNTGGWSGPYVNGAGYWVDTMIGVTFCKSGFHGGTSCGPAYNGWSPGARPGDPDYLPPHTFTASGYTSQVYMVELDHSKCGIADGDSGGPVFVDVSPSNNDVQVAGLMIGDEYDPASDVTPAGCYGGAVSGNSSYNMAFIPIWQVPNAFPNMGLKVVATDNLVG